MTPDPSPTSRHLRRSHHLRFFDADWDRAMARAEVEGYEGLREVFAGWLVAYGLGHLDAMPEMTETPDET